MRKRILSVLLACVLLFALVPSAHASAVDNFTDISAFMPEYENILRYIVEAKGDMNGTSATTFAPSAGIKRCDAILTLCRVFDANLNAYSNYANPFTDVPAGSYYEAAVKWAYYEGITSGTSATTFGSNDLLQRQHFCTFFSRFCTKMGVTLPNNGSTFVFSDDSSIGSTHKSHVYKLYRAGIITGTNGSNFTPTASIQRIHVARVLFNYYVPLASRMHTPSLIISSITPNSFKVAWAAISGASGYDVKLMRGSTIISGWTSNGTARSKTFTGLTADTTYTVRVRARKTYNGQTLYSQSGGVTIDTCIGTLSYWESSSSYIYRWGDSPSDIPTTVCTYRINADSSPYFQAGMSHAISEWNDALGCDMQRMTVPSMPTSAKIGYYSGTAAQIQAVFYYPNISYSNYGTNVYTGWQQEGQWNKGQTLYNGRIITSVRGYIRDYGGAQANVYKTCTHELGHAMGWDGHVSAANVQSEADVYELMENVMYALNTDVTALTPLDIRHIYQVYYN
jgi:hypothetical protein